MRTDPFRPTDEDARRLARDLIRTARHGALAVLREGEPFASRVALAPEDESFLALVSDLAPHTEALRAHPRASLMIGEPGKGDPLAHPRLTLAVEAEFIDKSEASAAYLAHQPKAKLYIEFADFHLVRLTPIEGLLNGGFGKAFKLGPAEFKT